MIIQIILTAVFGLGIGFLGLSIFDPRTLLGNTGYMYRGRGGVTSFLILLFWIFFGIYYLYTAGVIFNVLSIVISIIGMGFGLIFWRLFIRYNRKIKPYT